MSPAHHLVLALSCPDRPGIVHAVSGVLARHGGNSTESQQFGDPGTGLFFMRVQVEVSAERAALETDLATLADAIGMTGQDVERRVLARAVRWHAEHRVFGNGGRTVVFR